jgi:hypothetical protein
MTSASSDDVSRNSQPIRIGGAEVGEHGHVCAFFSDIDEQYRVLLPFIKEGLEQGDKSYQIDNPGQRADHCRRLEEAQIDVAAAEKAGAIEVQDWKDMYLPDGRFDQHRMLDVWHGVRDGLAAAGFPRIRSFARMDWALEEHDGVSDLIEYEARYNTIHRSQDVAICIYDPRLFSANILMDVLRVHPQILINGVLQENPFYVSPETFLKRFSKPPA